MFNKTGEFETFWIGASGKDYKNHTLTLRRPLRRKVRMTWFFDISMVKESSFFKSDLTDPLRFSMRIFLKISIRALPDFIFQWVLYQDHILSQMVS